jgi:hypothetical protein
MCGALTRGGIGLMLVLGAGCSRPASAPTDGESPVPPAAGVPAATPGEEPHGIFI